MRKLNIHLHQRLRDLTWLGVGLQLPRFLGSEMANQRVNKRYKMVSKAKNTEGKGHKVVDSFHGCPNA